MATMRTSKRRTYDDGCAAAHALDLIGERWALLVVRELLLGPKRFTDLRAGLPHASPNVLAQRLRELEVVGVVRRRKLPPPAASKVYELTDWGLELEPVIVRLGRWGARSPSRPRDAGLSVDSLILSCRTMFDPRAAEGLTASYELGSVRTASTPRSPTASSRSPAGTQIGPTRSSRPTLLRWQH
jgi:DNA-binding HxlR family transcriptional regulator